MSAGLARRLAAGVVMLVLDVLAVRLLVDVFAGGTWFLGVAGAVILLGLNVVVLGGPRLRGWRWLAPGLTSLVVLTVAPVLYTVYVSFTNYDANHQLTEPQAVAAIERETFIPPDAPVYQWAAYASTGGDDRYALWLVSDSGEQLLVEPGQPAVPAEPGTGPAGPAAEDGFPTELDGYTRLSRVEAVSQLTALTERTFGTAEEPIRISSLDTAARFQQRYLHDDDTGTITDQQTGTTFTAVEGTFTAADGTTIAPSFHTVIGADNYLRAVTEPQVRGPILEIFGWTLVFAVVVVGAGFVAGLALAVALNDGVVPRWLARVVRSVLLLPYVVPAYLTILVWGAMLNVNIGIIPRALQQTLGLDPNWVNEPFGARLAVLLVAFWLGFPYFLLICSGALQAIPAELIEAARVDGASAWRRFVAVVLPQLLRMLAPLLVLGLAFNFNNFLVVYLLKGGGPQKPDFPPPAGDTDLLISYTYKLTFDFGQNDYALAAVITMFIFAVLVPIVVSQFRYYHVWAED